MSWCEKVHPRVLEALADDSESANPPENVLIATVESYELKEACDKKDKKFDTKVNNFLRFAMDNFDTELVVMGIKLALTQYSLPIDPDEVDCFDEFHNRFGKYVTAAQSA